MSAWFRNKRVKGHSRWHWDDTPEKPDVMRGIPHDIRYLPLSLCKTANRMLMFDETNPEPPKEECCPLCLKELEKRNVPVFPGLEVGRVDV